MDTFVRQPGEPWVASAVVAKERSKILMGTETLITAVTCPFTSRSLFSPRAADQMWNQLRS